MEGKAARAGRADVGAEDGDLDAGRELHLCLGLMLQSEDAEHEQPRWEQGLGTLLGCPVGCKWRCLSPGVPRHRRCEMLCPPAMQDSQHLPRMGQHLQVPPGTELVMPWVQLLHFSESLLLAVELWNFRLGVSEFSLQGS